MISEYCKSHYTDFELYRYEDEGFTGANTNRPAFQKLTSDISERKIDILICYKIDRVSRDVKDFSNFFSFLQENKVEFVSIKEQIDTSTPLGRARCIFVPFLHRWNVKRLHSASRFLA